MPPEHRPTVRFRRIGGALRRARESAGLTIEAAARRYGRSPSWMSTVENGLQPVRTDDLTDLLDFYGVQDGPLRESLLHLAAQSRRKNWTRTYEDRISPAALDLASLEEDSASICTFQSNLIPGLLQTADYARAVMETGLPTPTRNNDELVAFRMARQAVLSRPDPPTYRTIVGEAVLHQVVGSKAVMSAQLLHLIQRSRSAHVAIHVLPYSASAYLGVATPYHLVSLRPPGRFTASIIDHFSRSIFIEDEQEVREHQEIFAHLLAAALNKSHSLKVIKRIASEA